MQETPKGLEVKISDDELKGRYSNLLRISHTREEFVLDFINLLPPQGVVTARVVTSPGHLSGGRARGELGMRGAGPQRVITDLALYDFEAGEMRVTSLHPGVTLDRVRDTLGWEPQVAPDIATTPPPTPQELHLLRHDLDPKRLYL